MADLSEAECRAVLERNGIGRLGCYSPQAQESYVIPVAYLYDGDGIYFGLLPGKKLRYVRSHPQGVCLEVEEEDARDGSWTTVVVTGDMTLIGRDPPELKAVQAHRRALDSLFRYGLSPFPRSALTLCRLTIRRVSGRRDQWTWQAGFPDAARTNAQLAAGVGSP